MKSSASLIEDMLSEHGHAIIEAAEGGRRGEAIVSQAEVVGVEVSAPVLLMEATECDEGGASDLEPKIPWRLGCYCFENNETCNSVSCRSREPEKRSHSPNINWTVRRDKEVQDQIFRHTEREGQYDDTTFVKQILKKKTCSRRDASYVASRPFFLFKAQDMAPSDGLSVRFDARGRWHPPRPRRLPSKSPLEIVHDLYTVPSQVTSHWVTMMHKSVHDFLKLEKSDRSQYAFGTEPLTDLSLRGQGWKGTCLQQQSNINSAAERLEPQIWAGYRDTEIRRARKECKAYMKLHLHRIKPIIQMLKMATATSSDDEIDMNRRLLMDGKCPSKELRHLRSRSTINCGQTSLLTTGDAEASSTQFDTLRAWCKEFFLKLEVKCSTDHVWQKDRLYTIPSSLGGCAIVAMLSVATHKLYNSGPKIMEPSDENDSNYVDEVSIFGWCLVYFLCVIELFANRERQGDCFQKQFILVGCVAGFLHGRVKETLALENLVQIYPEWITGVLILSWISHLILHQWRSCSSISGHGKNSINEEDEKSGFHWVRS